MYDNLRKSFVSLHDDDVYVALNQLERIVCGQFECIYMNVM